MIFWWKLPRLRRGTQGTERARARSGASLRLEVLEDRLPLSVNSVTSPLSHTAWRAQRFALADQVTVVDTAHTTWRGRRFSLDAMTSPAVQAAGAIGATTIEGGQLIGLDRVFSNYSYRGTGYSVAVIDTGIDYNHPALGGGWGRRVVGGWDFVQNDADPLDDNGHGTHVAGIIGSSDAVHTGVAPEINLIALKVLDASGGGSFGAMEDALRWVVAHQAQYNIVAVNMSLGAGNYTSDPYTFLNDEFASLKSQGVFIAAASGNSFYVHGSQPGLGYPAISPLAVAVGAVWADDFGPVSWVSGARDLTTAPDRITSFTQRSAGLDILAPGAMITSTYLGGGYQVLAGTSMATPVVAGAAAILHQALDAAGNQAAANQDAILALMQASGATVNDGDDENDNVVNTGMTFKRLDLFAALSTIRTDNQAPSLDAVADQIMRAQQDKITLSLSARDADGGAVSLSARALGLPSAAYELKEQLGLSYAGSYFANSWGMQEKWLLGNSSQWYFLLSGGELRRWAGTPESSLLPAALIATFDSSYYTDPSLLWNAAPATTPAVALTINGNQLTIDPATGYTGRFSVAVTAGDGRASASRSFNVTVVNSAPVLAPIADQTMKAGQDRMSLTLAVVDADADPLTYAARLVVTPSREYLLDQQLGLSFSTSYYLNWSGVNEKWLLGSGAQWYILLPNGELRKYLGSMAASLGSSALVATLDGAVYADPSLLWNAKAPVVPPVSLVLAGNQLTVDPAAGYTGSFVVQVTVADGAASATRSFTVTVANLAPALAAVPDQAMKARQDRITLTLDGSDADGDTLSYSARAVAAPSQAYRLDQQLGLSFSTSYYLNYWGAAEKWLLGSGSQWYILLPNGELRKAMSNLSLTLGAGALVATLDRSLYADPSLLWDARPPSQPAVAFMVAGNQLTIDPAVGYTGSFTVEATVTDGLATATRTFTVTVTNTAPVLGVLPNQTLRAGETRTLTLPGSDADGDSLTYSARALPIASQAYQLDQQLGLTFSNSYYTNVAGAREKWLLGAGSQWYILLPNGELRKYLGTMAASLGSGGLVASLDPSFYADPSLLWNARAPVTPSVSLAVAADRLTVQPANGYLGSFTVEVSASDGTTTTTRSFVVTVAG